MPRWKPRHSILDDEPKYGLAVTGFVHPDRVLTNSGAKAGDVVLMSPASAAFDQFKNFMVRGEYFKKLVKEL